MYRYLKDDLKVHALVSGTQLGYSPVNIQAGLDYIDSHAYWNHPHFPGRPWDPNNWTVRNVALVNHPGGTLAALASRRVAGMPYTVSEYNHPEPNQYAAEGFPMIAAYGAFQAWDAIFSFTYSHDTDFEPRKITGFFDIKGNTPRLVHMPACVAMFVRGDVVTPKRTVLVPLSRAAERKKLQETLSAWKLTAGELGFKTFDQINPDGTLPFRLALDVGKHLPASKPAATPPPSAAATPPSKTAATPSSKSPATPSSKPPATPPTPGDAAKPLEGRPGSDIAGIIWHADKTAAAGEETGYFLVNTPRTMLVTGFIDGQKFTWNGLTVSVGTTRLHWATISLVCTDGEGFGKPGHILIAATGLVHNEGAELQHLQGENVTLGNQWGSGPVLCEGIPAEIILPVDSSRVQFYPLDESGARRSPVAVESQPRTPAHLKLDPKLKTLWYEVEIR
jgi:hypothetical protein